MSDGVKVGYARVSTAGQSLDVQWTPSRTAGVEFVVLDQGIDTTTSAGRAMFGMLAVFVQFELDIRKDRQIEGIAKAKAEDEQFGRKRSVEPRDVVAAYKQHRTIGATAKSLGSTKPTVHQVLKASGVDTSRTTT